MIVKKLADAGDEHEMTDDVTQASNYVQQTDLDQESSQNMVETFETPRVEPYEEKAVIANESSVETPPTEIQPETTEN